MSDTGIATRLVDGVLHVALDRTRASNAVNAVMAQGFHDALRTAMRDDAVKAVVLTGAGDRVFSAGIDVKNPDGLDHEALSAQRRGTVTRCLTALVDFEKPLVAALNGHAIGLGCMMALLADRLVAADHASLSLPEVDIGIPTFLGMVIVTRAAGGALARDLVLTGRRMDAAEAVERGLVAQVTAAAALGDAAVRAALALAAKPAAAYALDKRWLARGLKEAFEEANAASQAAQTLLAGGAAGH